MSEEIKSIKITGVAADGLSGGAAKKGRRSTKKKQDGGALTGEGDALNGVSPIMANVKGTESINTIASAAGSPNPSTWLKYPVPAPVPPRIIPAASYIATSDRSAVPTGQYAQAGGKSHSDQKQIKVELKKKTTAKRVHLNPKRTESPKEISRKHQTRKHRKVSIGISTLHKRITRAKKLHKKVKEMPIDKLKDKLIKGGLIKSTSKAPAELLRQIAGDAAVVTTKAL